MLNSLIQSCSLRVGQNQSQHRWDRGGNSALMAVAIYYSSCSGRIRLQATLPFVLPLLSHACRLRPSTSTSTESVLTLAPCSRIINLPRSSIHGTVFPNSTRSFSSRPTSPAVQCSTMPRDVETRAKYVQADEPSMANNGWKIKMLYDGECPLCMREVNMLRERNKSYGDAIKFVDICADGYAPEENSNIDFETAMGRIHAIRQDGEVLTNIAAFRALYEEIGLGWVYAITYYQPWASIFDTIYEFWAKYRLPITGRPALAEVLENRRQRKVEGGMSSADEKRCRLD